MSEVMEDFAMSGEAYKESLRDERNIWYKGEKIDVTSHPATKGGVNWLADIYDLHNDPELENITTFIDDGQRFSTSWLVPETKEELIKRRKYLECVARQTFGFFGRQLDNIALTTIGFAAYEPTLSNLDPEHGENIWSYLEWAQKNNVISAGLIVEPQGAPPKEKEAEASRLAVRNQAGKEEVAEEDLLPANLQIVDENDEGIRISGAKTVGTIAPQGHELLIITQSYEEPDENIVCAVPVDAEGVDIVCREAFSRPNSSEWMHPISGKGDELDALIIFDDVFVPHDRVFCIRSPEIFLQYGKIGCGEHYSTLLRMCVKAEILAGAVQLAVNDLNTGDVQSVQEQVADVMEYAKTLRSYVLASEQGAQQTEGGVMFPSVNMITSGRIYGIKHYPEILQTVTHLTGQGSIMRFHEEDYDNEEIGPKMNWLLEGYTLPAKEKNLLMNLIWDLTQDTIGRRVEAFDRLNGYPIFLLKQRLYNEYDLTDSMEFIIDYLDLPETEGLLENADGIDQFTG